MHGGESNPFSFETDTAQGYETFDFGGGHEIEDKMKKFERDHAKAISSEKLYGHP